MHHMRLVVEAIWSVARTAFPQTNVSCTNAFLTFALAPRGRSVNICAHLRYQSLREDLRSCFSHLALRSALRQKSFGTQTINGARD